MRKLTVILVVAVMALTIGTAALAGTVTINAAAGYTIGWDGNEGVYLGGTPPPAPENIARVSGVTAFGSAELGDCGTYGHYIAQINDGKYGNSWSWLDSGPIDSITPGFIGLDFGGLMAFDSLAWGRDNTGEYRDRAAAVYTLQYTKVSAPGKDTAVTNNKTTGWEDIGTVTYVGGVEPPFNPYKRHQYSVGTRSGGPIVATGFRMVVSNNGTAIDELELHGAPVPEPGSMVTMLGFLGTAGLMFRRRKA